MYPISEKMKQSLVTSHRPMTIVKVRSINGVTTTIPVVSGSVTVDRTSQDFRRSVSFTTNTEYITNSDGSTTQIVPLRDTDPLNIYGNHAYVYRGVLWNTNGIGKDLTTCEAPIPQDILVPANGAYELVPLGVFRINSVSISEHQDGQLDLTVEGTDISSNISKNHWTSPVTVWKSKYSVPVSQADTTPEQAYVASTVKEAIQKLILDRWPSNNGVFGLPVFDFSGVADKPLTTPVVMGSRTISTSGSNSPWTDITGLSASLGAELFIDQSGKFTLRAITDPNEMPVSWSILDGDLTGKSGGLISITRTVSDAKTVNYVIATGENTGTSVSTVSSNGAGSGTPLKAVAYDNDPNSPTYYKGTFGRVVGYEPGRKKLKTQAEVQHAADTYLNWFIGGDETVQIESTVNPALDVGDVVKVRRKRVGVYNPEAVVCALNSDMTHGKSLDHFQITTLLFDLAQGSQVTLYTDFSSQTLTLSRAHKKGDTTMYVESFSPNSDYRNGTVLTDPKIPTDGSVNYFIDKLEIPLDVDKPMTITARERRVGTRKDAIRVAEYSQ